MNRGDLEKTSVCENLDALMNLDPRGYGVCRILYAGSRALRKQPLSLCAAQRLLSSVEPGDAVFILTGFVLLPHQSPETDGLVGSILLARALVVAFDATPIILCPEDCVQAVQKCAGVIGLHGYSDLAKAMELPYSMGIAAFTKDASQAHTQAEALLSVVQPAAMVAIEAPGANASGVYHNAGGKDVTALEAKTDILWNLARQRGVPGIAIGDLGNEIGMGALAEHILRYIPRAAPGECVCGCGGGILAASSADEVITSTCSDWGCYGLIAALAYLKGNMEILHTEDMEAEVLRVAVRNGMVDMNGSLLPGVDGFDVRLMVGVLNLMRRCTAYALKHSGEFEAWYQAVLEKEFFDQPE